MTLVKEIMIRPYEIGDESEMAEFTYIVDESVGVDNLYLDNNLKIYPLPVRDRINVSAGDKIIRSVILTSMNGAIVANVSKPSKVVSLNVSSLSQGVYIINVMTDNEEYSRKIMKVE